MEGERYNDRALLRKVKEEKRGVLSSNKSDTISLFLFIKQTTPPFFIRDFELIRVNCVSFLSEAGGGP